MNNVTEAPEVSQRSLKSTDALKQVSPSTSPASLDGKREKGRLRLQDDDSDSQFNKESTPKRLGNWQVPRWAPTRARPLEMRPDPKPICDINGHFLPGAPRGTSRCFGHFTGTWELPRKITRKVAEELAKEPPPGRFPDWLNLRVQRPKAASAARLRSEKRAKPRKETAKTELQAAQTFQPLKCPYHRKGKKKTIQRSLLGVY